MQEMTYYNSSGSEEAAGWIGHDLKPRKKNYLIRVEPSNNGHVGTTHFVLYRVVVLSVKDKMLAVQNY